MSPALGKQNSSKLRIAGGQRCSKSFRSDAWPALALLITVTGLRSELGGKQLSESYMPGLGMNRREISPVLQLVKNNRMALQVITKETRERHQVLQTCFLCSI